MPSKAELEAAANSAELVLKRPVWSSTEDDTSLVNLYAYQLNINKQISNQNKGHSLYIRCVQGRETIDGYEVVRVGSQIWMHNNINVETPTSVCALDDKDNCSQGRYYSPEEARNICPENFSLPRSGDLLKLNKDALYRLFKPMGVYDSNEKSFDDSQNVYVLGITTALRVRDMKRIEIVAVFKSFQCELKRVDYYNTYQENYKFPVRCIYAPESKIENE